MKQHTLAMIVVTKDVLLLTPVESSVSSSSSSFFPVLHFSVHLILSGACVVVGGAFPFGEGLEPELLCEPPWLLFGEGAFCEPLSELGDELLLLLLPGATVVVVGRASQATTL